MTTPSRIPRDEDDNASPKAVSKRAEFIREQRGANVTHIASGAIEPPLTKGSTEISFGAAVVHGDGVSSHDELGRNRP